VSGAARAGGGNAVGAPERGRLVWAADEPDGSGDEASGDGDVPVGKVRFYDAEKGFGFLTKDEGGDVYVRATALPPGVTALKAGQKVEFGVVEGRKGEQALSLRVVEAPPSLSKALRKPPEQMTVIVEDLIKMLDTLGNGYRRGRHPDGRTNAQVASVLRAVADELEL